MTAGKKSAVKAIIIVICLVLFAAAGVCLSPERGRLYPGDSRIKGTVSIYLDGKPMDTGGVTVTDVSRIKSRSSFEKDGNTIVIADRAGDKAVYAYELDIPECGSPVTVSVMHWDWHQVTRFDCELYLGMAGGGGLKAEYKVHSKASNQSVFEKYEHSGSFYDHEHIIITV